jgi:outer membrane protein assembly factor BamB
MTSRIRTALLLVLPLAALSVRAGDAWSQFRGPNQDGISDATELPTLWSETENVKFKIPIPGEGWSSPVVLGGQVWMTTATDEGHSLRAVCVQRDSGSIVHDVEVFHVDEPEHKNQFNSYASPTPVLEEGRVYVCFGAYGSACLDAETGRPIWKNTELKINHMEGPGSSPIIYKDLYILNCDGTDFQYVAALGKNTGKLAWKMNRSYAFGWLKIAPLRKAYSIPKVIDVGGRDELVSVGAYRVSAYEPATGEELWSVDHPGYSCVPVPLYGNGLVYVCTGYNTAELFAIRPGGSGDVTKTAVAWKFKQSVPYKPSPLLLGGEIYFAHDNGVVHCLDAKTGAVVWRNRLEGSYTASPVYAGGRIYFSNEKGKTTVIEAGREFKVIAQNQLPGRILASPAVVGDAIFLRTDTHLYRIEK